MKLFYYLAIIIVVITACNTSQKEKSEVNQEAQKQNLLTEHLVLATAWFQKSAEMRAIYYQTYNLAKLALTDNLQNATTDKPKAVVLDIDETVLDNSPFEVKCIETGIGYTPETWKTWTSRASAKILPGVEGFLSLAASKQVDVFYVSNRNVSELDATIKNLQKYNLPNVDSAHIFLRVEESSKTKRRNTILENYEVLLYIGDNLTDFDDLYKDRNANLGFEEVDSTQNLFGQKFIILPNPMYGEWEKALYENSYKISDSLKIIKRKEILDSF